MHLSVGGIAVIDLLLGWTVIGWPGRAADRGGAMTDEKLEFSAQDLGRLARALHVDANDVLAWVMNIQDDPIETRRVWTAIREGYEENE